MIRSLTNLLDHAGRGRRKFKSYTQLFGTGKAVRKIWRNVFLLENVYRLEKDLLIQETKVEPKIPLIVSPYNDLELNGWCDKQSILEIRGEYGLRQFKERFEKGDIFFAGYSQGRFAGFVWLECPPVRGAGYPLKNDQGYTYDGWTFSAYRGMRVLPVIQQSIMDYVRENRTDIHSLVTHVSLWNRPSLAGDQRAGYVVRRKELSLVFLGYHRKVLFREP